jgi:hypothetical protein
MSAGAARAFIDYAGLDDASKRAVAGGNLTRLTGLTPQEAPPAGESGDDDLKSRV